MQSTQQRLRRIGNEDAHEALRRARDTMPWGERANALPRNVGREWWLFTLATTMEAS